MTRISGVDLPVNRRIDEALPVIYGIGRSNAKVILKEAQVDPSKRAKDLTDVEVLSIQKVIEKKYMVEGDLRRRVSDNIARLVSIGTYRGIRHKRGLPSRGQRTRTNARTKRGKRKTVGALKKDDQAKVAPTTEKEEAKK